MMSIAVEANARVLALQTIDVYYAGVLFEEIVYLYVENRHDCFSSILQGTISISLEAYHYIGAMKINPYDKGKKKNQIESKL